MGRGAVRWEWGGQAWAQAPGLWRAEAEEAVPRALLWTDVASRSHPRSLQLILPVTLILSRSGNRPAPPPPAGDKCSRSRTKAWPICHVDITSPAGLVERGLPSPRM